jgi:hypothetical protein
MRRRDKTKNMKRVNQLFENRNKKNLLNEYGEFGSGGNYDNPEEQGQSDFYDSQSHQSGEIDYTKIAREILYKAMAEEGVNPKDNSMHVHNTFFNEGLSAVEYMLSLGKTREAQMHADGVASKIAENSHKW